MTLLGFVAILAGACAAHAAVPFEPTFRAVAGPRWIDRAAQVQAESAFNPRAVSPVGARGLAQFMPATWAEWAPGADPFDPIASIQAQHRYMLWLEARCGGQLDPALGAYNAGLGNIRKARRLADGLGLVGSEAWLRALPRVTGPAHAAETTGYLIRNRRFRAQLRQMSTRGAA
nr:lytic transglycosylase domain-containing protein [Geothrix fuzhouensis]